MEKNPASKYDKLKIEKNTSYVPWKPLRTVEETEEEERTEEIARNAGLIGGWPFYPKQNAKGIPEDIVEQYRFGDIISGLRNGVKTKTFDILKKNK